jgi:hypothetical protein
VVSKDCGDMIVLSCWPQGRTKGAVERDLPSLTGNRRRGKTAGRSLNWTRQGSAEPWRVFLFSRPITICRMTTQIISGVVPPAVAEATVMTVWPSVGSTGLGRALGRLYRIKSGLGPISVGRLALLATIPLGMMLYLSLRLPWAIRRYRLTNRRVTVERGVSPQVEQYVDLDRFDAIDLVVQPGQEWYDCGDLVFRRGPIETLRLPGVSRPEPFRQTCLKVRQSYVSVAATRSA